MIYHCLFEQSGTFKNVLKSYGHQAFDYDILNDFGETDFQIDLFKEIENEYLNLTENKGIKTIFSSMEKGKDFIIAFFPCTHFSGLNQFQYKLLIAGKKQPLNEKSVKRLIKRNQERAEFFEIYLKFLFICKTIGISTIIENPASGSGNFSYLELFSPIDVSYKEENRKKWGDRYRKPTIFFAINFDMKEEFQMFTPVFSLTSVLKTKKGVTPRSMIEKQYADNFYKRFLEVQDEKENKT